MFKRILCTVLLGLGLAAQVESAPGDVGAVAQLPDHTGSHWIWVSDLVLRRTALFDGDSGKFLGMLSSGSGNVSPLFGEARHEIYLAETHYERGTRGKRTDVVTIYDDRTLAPVREVEIPPKRAEHLSGVAGSALSDDGRFLAVFNLTPATSLSIVDLETRRFAGEISTPGCSLVYGAGKRRFAMLCGDGALLTVTLDDDGKEVKKERSEPFFDPGADPITEKGARRGEEWFFVSFEGYVHGVDLSGEEPAFAKPWSLFHDDDRADRWRVGGQQHLAVHEPTGRLFALVHQGGADTHKDPGTEVWVYDLEKKERVRRIAMRNQLGAFLQQTLEIDPETTVGGMIDWLLQNTTPNAGVDRIAVSQDAAPVLFTATGFPSTLSVHDAETGEFVRDLEAVGLGGGLLEVP